MNRDYEEEYSVLEIAKFNLKHWKILALCALICGLIAGVYGYRNTEPSVVFYQELKQVSSDYFMTEFNNTNITDRMYDLEYVAFSRGAYERFVDNTGYSLTFEEYKGLFSYTSDIVTSVVTIFAGYPLSVGDINVETDEEALALMGQLVQAHLETYDECMGEGAIIALGSPYTSVYTQAAADSASTPKDLAIATARGGIAGVFLGILLGIIAVSVSYLVGTVAKTAKEIEEKLKAPALAFVHKDDRVEEFKKVEMFLERSMGAHETVCYIPVCEKNTDGGYDLARAFARMNRKTLYINLSMNAAADGKSLSAYLFGGCRADEVNVTSTEDGVDVISRSITDEGGREFLSARALPEYISGMKDKYERIVVNAPDILVSTDAYAVASYCDRAVLGCKRRDITGTDLYEINNTMDNNDIKLDGVVVYGN